MTRSFEFTAGALSLDFIDTLAGASVEPAELLASPHDLSNWLGEAGVVQGLDLTGRDLSRALALREAVRTLLLSAVESKPWPADAVDRVNREAAGAVFRPVLLEGRVEMTSAAPFRSALAVLAGDALLLLRPEKLGRVRRCPECRMLFLDNSRPGRRVWCSSASGCGNRAKVRRHRARRATRDGERPGQ